MDASAPTQVIGEVSARARSELRHALLDAYARSDTYRGRFDALGLARRELEAEDPVSALRRMPPLRGHDLHEITNEAIAAASQVIDIETSSGTTGRRKRRVITHDDEARETALLAGMLRVCGIGGADRVACVDIGPLTLMVSFTKALDELGAAESYAYSVGPDVEATVRGLFGLSPTAIVTIPSVLDRCLDGLRSWMSVGPKWTLERLIFVGEPLARDTRRMLTDELGLQVFGYYGASETSALGVECSNHDGIHLFDDGYVFEVSGSGELLVTTLRQEGLPLVRYALGDLVEVIAGACPCGLPYPRVNVAGRTDATASVLGVKLTYDAVRDAALWGIEYERQIEVVLSRNGRERITVVLPGDLARFESKIRTSLATREPDLAYLVSGGFIDLKLVFAADGGFAESRKRRRIVDRRGGENAAPR